MLRDHRSRCLKNSYQTFTIIPVKITVATTIMPRHTNADMHFMYGFCNGNSVTALREYQH
jgi:hypothetical protein